MTNSTLLRWKKAGWWILGVLLVVPYLGGVGYLSYKLWFERPVLTLSSGLRGGLYYKIGEELPRILQSALDDEIRFVSRPSDGSAQNVDRIERGEAQLALAQDGLQAGPAVRALARLYVSPLHIVVRKAAGMKGVPDLVPRNGERKRRAFIGRQESGTRVVTELVLKQHGLSLSDLEIKGGNEWDIATAAEALKKDDIDVAFFLVGVGAEALNDLAADGRFTLLNVDRAEGIPTTFPYLGKVEILSLRSWALSTMQEKTLAFNMRRIFRKMDHAKSLINAAPERQPYRNEPEIRNLFKRLAIPIKKLEASGSCYMVQI
jgi:hypothetical protein